MGSDQGDEFSRIVAEAMEQLPEEFSENLKNIEIVIEDRPPPEIAEKLAGHHGLLLGLYQGIPLTKRSHYYGGVLPDKISIYRESILRISRSRDEAIEQIKRTLLHEIGHYFGIDDKRLRELGY